MFCPFRLTSFLRRDLWTHRPSHPSFSHPPPSKPGAPSWPVALLFPLQGQSTEAEYLVLQRRSRRLVELSDGQIEVLSMPSPFHQRIARYLLPPSGCLRRGNRCRRSVFRTASPRLWTGQVPRSGYCLSQAGPHFRSAPSAAGRRPCDGSRRRGGRGSAKKIWKRNARSTPRPALPSTGSWTRKPKP